MGKCLDAFSVFCIVAILVGYFGLAYSIYQIVSNQGEKVECTITFSDATGNRHQFVGKGEVW